MFVAQWSEVVMAASKDVFTSVRFLMCLITSHSSMYPNCTAFVIIRMFNITFIQCSFCFTQVTSATPWTTKGWSKKSVLFCFSSQSCVLQFFSIFLRWCRHQAWEILLTPIWIQLVRSSSGAKSSRRTLPQNQFF